MRPEPVGDRCPAAARTDRHIESLVHLFQQPLDVFGFVLAVGVHEDKDLAGGRAGAALDRRAIAHAVGV